MDFSTITNVLKLPKKVIFLILIISSVLLFSSQNFMETIALYKFKEEYTIWIGIVFLFTAGLSIINLIEFIQEIYSSKKKKKEELKLFELYQKEYQKILESLDSDELINIREFYLQEKNTIEMISNDSAVASLIKKGIISLVSKEGWSNPYTRGNVFIFELTGVAKKYFDTFDFLSLNSTQRPNWLNRIESSNKMKQNIENLQKNMISSM